MGEGAGTLATDCPACHRNCTVITVQKFREISQTKKLIGLDMKHFLLMASLAIFLAFSARAQTSSLKADRKIPRVGILSAGGRLTDGSPSLEAFKQGLRDLGYVEGQNIILELRNAEGKYDQIPRLASELISLNVDVIVASSTTDAAVASKATKTIPIVYMGADPVDNALTTSRKRPGENITGITVSPD